MSNSSRRVTGQMPMAHTQPSSAWWRGRIGLFVTCLVTCELVVALFGAAPAQAQGKGLTAALPADPAQTCTPVDLMFVVDQSQHIDRDDPAGMRVEAVKWLVNFLGMDPLMGCPNTEHRFGLISFSERARTDVPLTPLSVNVNEPDALAAWDRKYNDIVAPMQQGSDGPRTKDALQDALLEASSVLEQAPAIGRADRKKAIVLIMGGGGSFCNDDYCAIYQMDSQQRELKTALSQASHPWSLWVITYGTDTQYHSSEYWQNLAGMHAGRLFDLEDGGVSTGRTLLKDILLTMTPRQDVTEVCGTAYVDPFLSVAAFHVLLSEETAAVTLGPQSSPVASSQPPTVPGEPQPMQLVFTNQGSRPRHELYYIYTNPVPGAWPIPLGCSSGQALVFARFARAHTLAIVSPSEPLPQFGGEGDHYDANDLHYLTIQVQNDSGGALAQFQGYAGLLRATVTSPKGESQGLTFHYENGGYKSNEPLWVDLEGDYSVAADFSAPGADENAAGQPATSIHLDGKYSVGELTPFIVRIETPNPNGHVSVHGNLFDHFLAVRPIDVRVKLEPRESQENEEHPAPDLSTALGGDLTKAVKVVLYYPATGQNEVAWLEQSPTDKLVFTGKVGNQITAAGDYSIKASYEAAYDTSKFRLASSPEQERLEFQRADGPFETAAVYLAVLCLLAGAALWALGRQLFLITDPASGYLMFVPAGGRLKPFAMLNLGEQGRRKVAYDEQDLKARGWLLSNLRSITVETPRPFGDTRKVTIVEDVRHQDGTITTESFTTDVPKDPAEKPFTVRSTSAHYDVHYDTKPPKEP